MPIIRVVDDPTDPAIEAFGDLQRHIYANPDLLIPEEYISAMIEADTAAGGESRQNFLVVAEADADRRLLGGTFFHLLLPVGSGFSSFMGVAPDSRGQGISRLLHAKRFAVLDAAAGPVGVPGVFIDVVAPKRLSAAELAAEAHVGTDPNVRREIFQRLGFRQVAIRYEQPVGGPNGGPLETLDLLYCPHPPRPDETDETVAADRVPTVLVVETMRAYWTPWLGSRRADRAAEALLGRAAGAEWLPLRPATD